MQAKHQMPSFKNSSRNTEKMKKETSPAIPPRNMNYTKISAFNQTKSYFPSSSSARNFGISETSNVHRRDPSALHPLWSMESLMEVLPESPSPVCSHDSESFTNQQCPIESETYYSDIAIEFPTPRKQNLGTTPHDNNYSNCSSLIDEWLEQATKFCPSNDYTREYGNLRQNGIQAEKLGKSSIWKTFLSVPEDELYKITLPSVREESPVNDGENHVASIDSPGNERRNLISRPKPYKAFLNEIEREKRDALKKAKQKKMDRISRKEAAIDDWELQQTNDAIKEMMKHQNKQEYKRLEASAKAHKKICSVKRKAEKRKANLRQSMELTTSSTSISDTFCCRNLMWLKPGPIC